MAKKKQATEMITLVCEGCKEHNYTTRKNKRNTPERMERKKFCSRERKHTIHKEKK